MSCHTAPGCGACPRPLLHLSNQSKGFGEAGEPPSSVPAPSARGARGGAGTRADPRTSGRACLACPCPPCVAPLTPKGLPRRALQLTWFVCSGAEFSECLPTCPWQPPSPPPCQVVDKHGRLDVLVNNAAIQVGCAPSVPHHAGPSPWPPSPARSVPPTPQRGVSLLLPRPRLHRCTSASVHSLSVVRLPALQRQPARQPGGQLPRSVHSVSIMGLSDCAQCVVPSIEETSLLLSPMNPRLDWAS